MCDANHVFAFVLCSHRKFITLRVLDREEYEKECSFFLVLGDPVWLRRGVKGVRVKPDQLSRRCCFLCVSLLSHSFLLALWLLAVFALPPSKLGRCTFLLCFLSSFVWRGLHPTQWGPREQGVLLGPPRQGTRSATSPQRRFGTAAAPSFNQREHPASTSKKGDAASFLSEDKPALLEIKCMARAVILAFLYWH